jgi:DNA-binding GntR family transcriptional regulator
VRIDPDDVRHPYVQLADTLRSQISSGQLAGRIPSINQLAEQYELSPATVKRALGILADEGLIHSVRGRGNFTA